MTVVKSVPFLIGVVMLAGCGATTSVVSPAPSRSATAATAPAPAANTLSGVAIVPVATVEQQISSGKPVVLMFMAPGCTSCATQATAAAQALSIHPGVEVVGVDMFGGDTASDLSSFLSGSGLDTLPLSWTIDTTGALTARYNVVNLGETVGLARGAVRFHNVADADAAQLSTQIATLT